MIKHNLVPRVLRTWERGCIKHGDTIRYSETPKSVTYFSGCPSTGRNIYFRLWYITSQCTSRGYQMKHSFSCSIYHFFFGEQGMAQWWERSPPTNVARVQIPASTPYVGWVCCWFSPLLREVFLRYFGFPLSSKTSNSTGNQVDEEQFVDVLPPNHYLFFYLFIYYLLLLGV